jgi:hypothetical protein
MRVSCKGTDAIDGQTRTLQIQANLGFIFSLAVYVVLFLFVSQTNGQVSPIVPEWKAHFKATPVVENCVFERIGNGQTNLFQFRYQENAFLFRQIRNLDDVSSNHIPIMDFYAGRFESNCWAIDSTSDTFGLLRIFPNADNIWKKQPKTGNESGVFWASSTLFSALYYGIMDLDPATVEWSEESKFTAFRMDGRKIVGKVTEASQGRPTVLEWRFEKPPNTQFTLEYKYDVRLDLPYYPSEFRLFMNVNGGKELGVVYKILILKTSTTPLEEDFFDPKRYFVKPPFRVPSRVSTVLSSNNETYDISGGHPVKVLPSSMIPANISSLKNGGGTITHAKSIRLFFLVFVVLSVIGFLFIWKRTKK